MANLLTRAFPAKLDASLRLSQAISEFGALLDSVNAKHHAVFKTLRTRKPPTAYDVLQFTEELNRDGLRLHRTWWKRYGTRLVKILDHIQIVMTAGDILIGGSQNMIASGVWAVVRLSLQVRNQARLPCSMPLKFFCLSVNKTGSPDYNGVSIFLQGSLGRAHEDWHLHRHQPRPG